MSKFTDDIILKVNRGTCQYEVYESFTYYQEINKESIIEVPKGFKTDLASIPRIFWTFLPPNGQYQKAAVLHDYLCVMNRLSDKLRKKEHDGNLEESGVTLPNKKEFLIWGKNENNYIPLTREITDKIFLEAMVVTGVNKFQAKLLYYFVRFYAKLFRIK